MILLHVVAQVLACIVGSAIGTWLAYRYLWKQEG